MKGNINMELNKLEKKTRFIEQITKTGLVKMKPLSSNDFIYLVASGENPDAKMIISVEDYTGTDNYNIDSEVAKLIYQLINLIFVKKAPMPEGMNYLVSLRNRFNTIIDAMAYVRRKHKLIPMVTFSVSPGANSIRVSIITHLMRVDDTRKLRVKMKNALGEEVYMPQVYDKILVTYSAEKWFMKGTIQTKQALLTHAHIYRLAKLIKGSEDGWKAITYGNRLLKAIWMQYTKHVSSEILPKDYSIGKNPSPIELIISKGSLFTESLVYPQNRLLELAINKGIIGTKFVLEYTGIHAKSYKLIILKNETIKVDEKEYNLETVTLDEILSKLALGTSSTILLILRHY